jgi:hypothetical protein
MDQTRLGAVLQLLNEQETSRLLHVSKACLRRWRRENRGPAYVRCGRCIRYSLAALQLYIFKNSSK